MELKKTKTEAKTETKKETPPAELYTAEELAANHKVFKTSREIVVVALKLAKKDKATVEETQKLVDELKNRRVK